MHFDGLSEQAFVAALSSASLAGKTVVVIEPC